MQRAVRAIQPWLVATALVELSGCGMGGSATPADPNQAKNALSAALDAWKNGGKPADLEKHSPPIHVRDVDWIGGFSLVSYKADKAGKLSGYDMNYPVDLELKTPKGETVKKSAVYTVTTGAELLISRQEG
jgi:hypothetical protein